MSVVHAMPDRMPRPLECWRHHKGDLYEIVGTGLDAETGDAKVYYRRAGEWSFDRMIYDRPLHRFLGYTEAHEPRFKFERVTYR
jgi:hypothetical protein